MFKLSKILPLLAIVAGFAGSAFTAAQQTAQTEYFWYSAIDGSSLGHGTEPSNGCETPGIGCALGFTQSQTDPLSTPPDETRAPEVE